MTHIHGPWARQDQPDGSVLHLCGCGEPRDLDSFDLFNPSSDENFAAIPRRCGRHDWMTYAGTDGVITRCRRCDMVRDEAAARRGRTNRSRGNAIEREIGGRLGLKRVGQYGGPDDLSGEMFSVQVKSGGSFPERLWGWLRAVPHNATQTPLLVVTDAPGPGRRRRALVVVDIDDWVALHGPLR